MTESLTKLDMYGTAKYMHRVGASAMQNGTNPYGMKVDRN